jgi:hypothetical protein
MKRSDKALNNDKVKSEAMIKYNSCNANHIREFIKETEKPTPICKNLYKHLMRTDIFWMTRAFMTRIHYKIKKHNKKKTIREYVRTELYRHCPVNLGAQFVRYNDEYFKTYITNNNSEPQDFAYYNMINNSNALMLNLSPCMAYIPSPQLPIIRYLNIDNSFSNVLNEGYSRLFELFYISKNAQTGISPLIYQSLYNFVDNPNYSNSNINSYYAQKCLSKTQIQKEENKSLFSKLLAVQKEFFFDDIPQNDTTLYNYPPGYFPGHLPVFYSHMVSLSERSKSKLLNRPGIKPPEMINCDNLITIFNGMQKQSPYTRCNTEKCLAEFSREETIWIFLDKLKQILNDKTSYNCDIN